MVIAATTPSVPSHVRQVVEHQSSPEPLDLGALLHIEPKIEHLCCLELTPPSRERTVSASSSANSGHGTPFLLEP
jgi:hypothetical protein